MAISLQKVEQQAPEMVDLFKKTAICLDKVNLTGHQAQVAIVLDISGSMSGLYNSGKVHELVKKTLALGLNFDLDGSIDCFAFGVGAYEVGTYTLDTYRNCVQDVLRAHPLESGTRYGEALKLIHSKYRGSKDPVYVVFVTDGETSSPEVAEREIIEMSKIGVYIQFVAIGQDIDPGQTSAPKKKGFFGALFTPFETDFKFLAKLDTLPNRKVDNCGFFAIKDPAAVSDEKLYELLMSEYPSWVKSAKNAGIL
jgi:hypothetical protein